MVPLKHLVFHELLVNDNKKLLKNVRYFLGVVGHFFNNIHKNFIDEHLKRLNAKEIDCDHCSGN